MPSPKPARQGPPPLLVGAVLLMLLAAAFLGLERWSRLRTDRDRAPGPEFEPLPALRGLGFPSPQAGLLGPDWRQAVQPTVSGRPESALYGSTRTGSDGRPQFHEGLDIAVVERDARGVPLDPVFAVADGRVAFVNRSPASSYGLYVVLAHADPVGTVYTLYAHLAELSDGLAEDLPVSRGGRLGTVGRTPVSAISLERAHLHFEIALLANSRFAQRARTIGQTNPYGAFHGFNLLGLDPLPILEAGQRDPAFSLLGHLRTLPPAFSVAVRSRGRKPDFFRRYPALWSGPADGPVFVIGVSAGGVPLWGRLAEPEEAARLGRSGSVVLTANDAELERNGRRLAVRENGDWRLGRAGEDWLDLLLY